MCEAPAVRFGRGAEVMVPPVAPQPPSSPPTLPHAVAVLHFFLQRTQRYEPGLVDLIYGFVHATMADKLHHGLAVFTCNTVIRRPALYSPAVAFAKVRVFGESWPPQSLVCFSLTHVGCPASKAGPYAVRCA
jgi:hypothetical protein